jgi:V/A-type H+-transporting ATPase subunit E
MTVMNEISEAVLEKVRAEAQDLLSDAKAKGTEAISRARDQKAARLQEEKSRMLVKAQGEATRTMAQSSIRARQELLKAKTDVVKGIIDRVKKALVDSAGESGLLLVLIREGVELLGVEKVKVSVSARDVAAVRKLVKADKELTPRVAEVRETDCTGGVIVEDPEGKIRVDNTYETRLAMLFPRLLPQIEKGLFRVDR